MPEYLIGVDNGGTMAKAAVFSADGREIAVASRRSEMLDTQPGWAEFDMHRVWTNTAQSIREALETSGINPTDVACVACTGHGNGLYLVDGEGQPVRNAIGSADGRARQYVEKWSEDGTLDTIRPKTMQRIWPAQPNALLRWLRDHEPETMRKARWVLMCKDFLRTQLTGEVYMETDRHVGHQPDGRWGRRVRRRGARRVGPGRHAEYAAADPPQRGPLRPGDRQGRRRHRPGRRDAGGRWNVRHRRLRALQAAWSTSRSFAWSPVRGETTSTSPASRSSAPTSL